MFLTALYIHFGQVFRSTVDSSCTALRQYTQEDKCYDSCNYIQIQVQTNIEAAGKGTQSTLVNIGFTKIFVYTSDL